MLIYFGLGNGQSVSRRPHQCLIHLICKYIVTEKCKQSISFFCTSLLQFILHLRVTWWPISAEFDSFWCSYLWEEWKERHPESALDISDKFLNLRFVSLEVCEHQLLVSSLMCFCKIVVEYFYVWCQFLTYTSSENNLMLMLWRGQALRETLPLVISFHEWSISQGALFKLHCHLHSPIMERYIW